MAPGTPGMEIAGDSQNAAQAAAVGTFRQLTWFSCPETVHATT